jgi:hypothetical protein
MFMRSLSCGLLSVTLSMSLGVSAWSADPTFEFVPDFIKPPRGMATIGDGHGEIQVDAAGNIYVSVEKQSEGGLQVYGADGVFIRQIPCPGTIHGFAIRTINGEEAIYATVLAEAKVIKMKTDGTRLMEIPTSAFPTAKAKSITIVPKTGEKFNGTLLSDIDGKVTVKKEDGTSVTLTKDEIKKRSGGLKLTNCDVASNGDIFVVDGYGKSWIFVFDKDGKLKAEFGGPGEPLKLNNAHKIHLDNRFDPPRLFVCDRGNNRILHLNLDGTLIGEIPAEGLRRPSAASFHGDYVAVAEIAGRVSVLNKEGKVVVVLGVNDTEGQTNTPKVTPADWRNDVVTSPHGITFDAHGNIMECEWNTFGRVLRWNLK